MSEKYDKSVGNCRKNTIKMWETVGKCRKNTIKMWETVGKI